MRVTIRDAGDLKAVTRQLREVANGKELRKELTSGIRDALRPLVPLVQGAYLAQPGHKGRRTRSRARQPDLRALLARSVRVEVRTTGKLAGARIRADGRRMPNQMKALPRYWEGPTVFGWSGRWRHPVFAGRLNRTRTHFLETQWVAQESHPTFYRTVGPHTDNVGRAIDRVFDATRRKLEAGR